MDPRPPLIAEPLSEGSEYVFVSMRKDYDEKFITTMHGDFYLRFFPIKEEMDPLDVFLDLLHPESTKKAMEGEEDRTDYNMVRNAFMPSMDMLVAFHPAGSREGALRMEGHPELGDVVGSCLFEYYPTANAGLLSYIAIEEPYRSCGIAQQLVKRVRESIRTYSGLYRGEAPQVAEGASHTAKCLSRVVRCGEDLHPECGKYLPKLIQLLEPYFGETGACSFAEDYPNEGEAPFLLAETNAEGVEDGIMEPSQRHKILHRLGFRMLDFDYVQMPLAMDLEACRDLLLLAHSVGSDGEEVKELPACAVYLFLISFTLSIADTLPVDGNRDFDTISQSLRGKVRLALNDALPWSRRTPP